jgi:hypothetical protein
MSLEHWGEGGRVLSIGKYNPQSEKPKIMGREFFCWLTIFFKKHNPIQDKPKKDFGKPP